MEDDAFLRDLSAKIICRIIYNAKKREYYQTHKEQHKSYIDPEKAKEAFRRYYRNHPDKVNARVKKWRENNPDKVRARAKRWKEDNPEKEKLSRKQRKYRNRNAEGRFTLKEWNVKLEEYNYRCAYCGCELNSETITVDHKVPLSRGGANYIWNVVPACKTCNSKKYNKSHNKY